MPLSDVDSRPISVPSGMSGTRWVRSPAAMRSAVRSTSSSGRSPSRITTPESSPTRPRVSSPTASAASAARWTVSSIDAVEIATTTVPEPSDNGTATAR